METLAEKEREKKEERRWEEAGVYQPKEQAVIGQPGFITNKSDTNVSQQPTSLVHSIPEMTLSIDEHFHALL